MVDGTDSHNLLGADTYFYRLLGFFPFSLFLSLRLLLLGSEDRGFLVKALGAPFGSGSC